MDPFQLFVVQMPAAKDLAESLVSPDKTVSIPVVYDCPLSFGRVEIKIDELKKDMRFRGHLCSIKHQLDLQIPLGCFVEGFFEEMVVGGGRLYGVLNFAWDPY